MKTRQMRRMSGIRMRKRLSFLALLLFALNAHSQGTLLSTYTLSQVNGIPHARNYVTFVFGLAPGLFPPSPTRNPTIFENLLITTNDVGSTFSVASTDDLDFDNLAALLANGTPCPHDRRQFSREGSAH
jgi:hypothetical protein